MANIRELTLDEITLVSGGNANSNFEGGPRNDRSSGARNSLGRNAPTHIYSDPSTVKCANAVFSGMIGGAIKGGPIGMARGTIGGAVVGQCLSDHGSGNGGGNRGSSSSCSGNNVGGTCNR